MSDDPKDKSDITRIEDLGEFEHEEDLDTEEDQVEEIDSDEDFSLDSSQDEFGSDDISEEEEEEDLDETSLDSLEPISEFEEDFSLDELDQENIDSFIEENSFDDNSDFLTDENETTFKDSDDSNPIESVESTEPILPVTPNPVEEVIFQPSKDITEISESLNSITYGDLPSPGNPPFSIKLTQIKYKEDTDYIMQVLTEFHLVNEKNQDDFLLSLQRGMLLIPRISEYMAIALVNKLRVVQADLIMGLAAEIQTSELFNETERGLISKDSVNMNYETNSAHKSKRQSEDQVILSTHTVPIGYIIESHIGMATESTLLDMSQFEVERDQLKDTFEVLTETNERSHPLTYIYSKLSQKLKIQAFEQYGNGVVGIGYQINPIVSDADPTLHYYQVVCTGDIVVLKPE